jgi:energy-converting hydrogenase Eha subunit A
MSWTWTFVLLLAGLALTIFHLVQANKTRRSFDVSLVTSTVVLFIGVLLIMIAGSHMLTLLGVQHGRGQWRF